MKQSETDSNTPISEEANKAKQGPMTDTKSSNEAKGDEWPSSASDLKNVRSLTGNQTSEEEKNSEKKPAGESLLEKFFNDQLKDIYYAEQQLLKAIPKLEEAATTEELKEAFSDHLHQTQKHVKRLEKVFKLLGKKPEGKKCEAIEGLTKEAETIIKETKEGSMTRDAAIIIAAQKVEHYEIATYGGLVQLAITMELDEISDILDTTLMEEEDTDLQLTDIAEGFINIEAQDETNYSWLQEKGQEEFA